MMQFFHLHDLDLPNALCAIPERTSLDVDALIRGQRQMPEPLKFSTNYGEKAFDFVVGGDVGLYLISQRARVVLSGFTGSATFPAVLRAPSDDVLQGFCGLVILGSTGPLDFSRSRIETKEPMTAEGASLRVHVGLYFDPATWDGSDLFMPAGSRFVICSERLRDAVMEAELTNIVADPVERVEVPLVV